MGFLAAPGLAEEDPARVDLQSSERGRITLVVRDASIAEVCEMLSRHERVNIMLGEGVEGDVSISLYDESFDRVVRAVAEAGGYVAARRGRGYAILDRDSLGKDAVDGNTIIRTMQVHYTEASVVAEILEKHLSRYGELTVLSERELIVVEDLPEFVDRIAALLDEIDRQPRQILIEAKIFEVSLEESQNLGIDWVRTFEAFDGVAEVGVVGLANPAQPGLVFDIITPEMIVLLTSLADDGRVRTLATPSLLTLEHEEAEVVIGDRLGYRVITTQNTITSESVEFLESGVILRIEAAVDRSGRIMLAVHPEVSTGVIDDGLPSQTTTEVTTRLIAEDGRPVFIAGLIRDRSTARDRGIPYLKDIPVAKYLFSRDESFGLRTETVVILTAHAVDASRERAAGEKTRWVPDFERGVAEGRRALDADLASPPVQEP
jgi:type II secretory pathway component GspD/PulD (secretin)